MYIVAIAWLYVALMMAVAEATNSNGTLLGAIVTFLLYGLGPVALVLYLMTTPARRKRARAQQAAADAHEQPLPALHEPDAGGHAPADAVAPVRKEP